ncbi:hypothetical protein EDB81DRAFT_262733 [Dactylonectria macrodidyma]|uniref:Uncharacterized protein n=1 Tax=Dactylonectria macrodidyma TaxID=307937 RepID=A0A9P9FM15_9HYPO|nr:hypothetical protein EDB81DRAFT_262733 [Dactylonectria macrodidyma]
MMTMEMADVVEKEGSGTNSQPVSSWLGKAGKRKMRSFIGRSAGPMQEMGEPTTINNFASRNKDGLLLQPLPSADGRRRDVLEWMFSSGHSSVNVGVRLSLLLFVAPQCSANGLNPAKHSCSQRTRSCKSKYPLQPMCRRLNPKTSCPSTRGVSRWVTTGPDAGPCRSHGTLGMVGGSRLIGMPHGPCLVCSDLQGGRGSIGGRWVSGCDARHARRKCCQTLEMPCRAVRLKRSRKTDADGDAMRCSGAAVMRCYLPWALGAL